MPKVLDNIRSLGKNASYVDKLQKASMACAKLNPVTGALAQIEEVVGRYDEPSNTIKATVLMLAIWFSRSWSVAEVIELCSTPSIGPFHQTLMFVH